MHPRLSALIGTGMRAMLSRRIAQLNDRKRWGAHTQRIQMRTLRGHIEHAKHTEHGRTHRFDRLVGLSDDDDLLRAYRESTPHVEIEDLRDTLERMRSEGEPSVLWPGHVERWAETSGTTGGQKYLPLTDEMMRSNFKAALDIFAHAHRFGVSLPSIFAGRLMFLGGSTDLRTNEHGFRTGDLSAIAVEQICWPLSEVYTPGRDIALMPNWNEKIQVMAQHTSTQDVRMLSGMASWGLVVFEKILEYARERDPSINCVRDVWPNLQLFVHGGVKYAPFQPRVSEAWSGRDSIDIPHRLEVYPASEGFIAVQDEPNTPGKPTSLRLHVDTGIFWEFIPLEEIDSPHARAVPVWEAEPGVRYVVCMTTCAGLWRYIIGDVVVFDEVPPHAPARLRIVGRHKHFINAFGENLIVEQIEYAVEMAQHGTKMRTGEFTAAPVYPGDGHHACIELAIETDAPAETVRRFAEIFDSTLRMRNQDYFEKREGSTGLEPAILTPLPFGTIHAWMDSIGKLGGQRKVPRCANHRDYISAIRERAGLPPIPEARHAPT